MNDPIQLCGVCAVSLPPFEVNVVFNVSSMMLELLRMKGLYVEVSHENPHEHIQNFVDVMVLSYSRTYHKNQCVSGCFHLYLMGESSKWLAELLRDSITSWMNLPKCSM